MGRDDFKDRLVSKGAEVLADALLDLVGSCDSAELEVLRLISTNPHFSPVIYCDARYTTPCRAFRNSPSSTYRKYACVGRVPKNPTWHGASGVSLRKPVRSAG